MTIYSRPRSSYPLRDFPGLQGMVARDLTASGSVAPEIVGTELIVFASLLAQGLADVAWPNGHVVPLGSNAVLAAPPGSGKTLAFKILMRPVEEFLSRGGLAEKVNCELLLEDATREAVVQSLHECPVAGLLTDEAGMLKRLLKDAPTLVKLLDGSPLRSARVSTGRVTLVGQRLCMLLMEQPEVFQETKSLLGARKGGVGLINRFFVTLINDFHTESSPHDVRLSTEVAQAYGRKVEHLLGMLIKQLSAGGAQRPTLRLSAHASECLRDLDREARRNCAPGAPWAFVAEYVLRHAERVLRLAGAFHVCECGPEGEISLDTLERAERFGNWYVESYARIVYEPPKKTQAEVDATELERTFVQTSLVTGMSAFRQSEMRTQAMNIGLTPTRFARALAVLCQQGRTRMLSYRNVPWIELLSSPHRPSY